jgi:predicted NAD/FAD-dependent oxidoreductase
VTVIDAQNKTESELIEAAQNELKTYCNIHTTRFVQLYHIPQSLPNISNLQYEVAPSETQLTESIFLAGDVQLNGSLNAAMISGENAAQGIIELIDKQR